MDFVWRCDWRITYQYPTAFSASGRRVLVQRVVRDAEVAGLRLAGLYLKRLGGKPGRARSLAILPRESCRRILAPSVIGGGAFA
jgi:hypothetical protein